MPEIITGWLSKFREMIKRIYVFYSFQLRDFTVDIQRHFYTFNPKNILALASGFPTKGIDLCSPNYGCSTRLDNCAFTPTLQNGLAPNNKGLIDRASTCQSLMMRGDQYHG
ncbi:MAG: hypothetical protein AAFY20_10000 [Cyanobacteria bacterium J06639_14]